jgi:hypothetical protein
LADINLARCQRFIGATRRQDMRTMTTVGLVLMVLGATMPAAGARGGHGGHGGSHTHGIRAGGAGSAAGDKAHANDAYIKAASDEEDRLLDNKLKSICRGC